MTLQTIMDIYTENINWLARMSDKKETGMARDLNLSMLRKLKRELIYDDVEIFNTSTDTLPPEREGLLPHGYLNYWMYSYPIYVDDPGQQLVLVIDDTEYGGGAFDAFPEIYFTDIIDSVSEPKLFKTAYEREMKRREYYEAVRKEKENGR